MRSIFMQADEAARISLANGGHGQGGLAVALREDADRMIRDACNDGARLIKWNAQHATNELRDGVVASLRADGYMVAELRGKVVEISW